MWHTSLLCAPNYSARNNKHTTKEKWLVFYKAFLKCALVLEAAHAFYNESKIIKSYNAKSSMNIFMEC